jgi:hypothetical protein
MIAAKSALNVSHVSCTIKVKSHLQDIATCKITVMLLTKRRFAVDWWNTFDNELPVQFLSQMFSGHRRIEME